MQFLISTFLTFFLIYLAYINAAPTDGLTKRAPGVIGLDVDIIRSNVAARQNEKRAANFDLHLSDILFIGYFLIGSNKEKVGLAMDTGSADMWVPTPKAPDGVQKYGNYDPQNSTTLKSLGRGWSGSYGLSTGTDLAAELYTDTVSFLDESVVLKDFEFGVSSQTTIPWGSGLCGIALPQVEATRPVYPNLPQALKNAGYISKNAYSLFVTSAEQNTGSLLFGGIDLDKIDGPLVPIPSSDPEHLTGSLSIYLRSLGINGQTLEFNQSVVLDSGTTYTHLEETFCTNLLKTQYGWDGVSTRYGFPIVTKVPKGNLSFNLDGISIEIPQEKLVIQDSSDPLGTKYIRLFPSSMQILGGDFLQHSYVVFNNEERSVSIGKLKYSSTSNIVNI